MKHYKSSGNFDKWVIVVSIGIIGLLILALALSKSSRPSGGNTTTSQLQAIEGSFDFGSISMAKGKVNKVFTFKNNTASVIIAKKLYTSCMCTKATFTKGGKVFGPFGMPAHGFIPSFSEIIEPGQEAQVEVVFDPAAHGPAGVGTIERQATLETSDGQIVFKFKAQVTP